MTTKVIQIASVGTNSTFTGKDVTVIDMDCEEYAEYQIYFKQYMSDITIFNDNLEKYFNLLLDQCSPSMEQSLAGEKEYEKIKEKYDVIELIKLIERICYNY